MKGIDTISLDRLADEAVRDSFSIIKDEVAKCDLVQSGMKFFEISFTKTGTYLVAHGLGLKPRDVIQTSVKGTGTVVWNFDSFDLENLSLTIGGTVSTSVPCVVRAFIGAYLGD